MAVTTNKYILNLTDVSRKDVARVGVKAANLGEMSGAGLQVPDGFVLTTDAFERFTGGNNLDGTCSENSVAFSPLPQDVEEAILKAAERLGDIPLAVRSSGVAEDLAGASYAGQYETVLGVRGAEALVKAVKRCWASSFSRRVRQYRNEKGQEGLPALAVLVQKLVAPDAAGVAFSANPVTGDDEVVVSAVKGLGERLVSGQAMPDEWIVKGESAICQRDPEKAIDAAQAVMVAELARKAKGYFNAPQDIEWALAGGKLYLLQARPITALPRRPVLDIPGEGFWTKDSSHFPAPLTPFGASVYLPAIEQATIVMCQELGLPIERIQNRSIGGEAYMRVVPLGGKERPAPPSWVIFLAARLAPPFRRCSRISKEVFRSGMPESLTDRWYNEWRTRFKQEARDLRGQDLTGMDDGALLQHLDQATDLMRRGQVVHFRLFGPYLFGVHALVEACEEFFGWDTAKTMSLLAGLSETSSEPARKLAELGSAVRRSLPAKKIIAGGGRGVLTQLGQEAPAIASMLQTYLEEYGHRTVNYEPGSPTLAEKPELLVRLLQGMIAGNWQMAAQGLDRSRREAITKARDQLAKRPEKDRKRFESALVVAERVYPMREDNIFYTDTVPNGVLRYAVIEIGRRMASRGALSDARDAVYLEDTELRAALSGKLDSPSSLVERRKAEQAWVAAHPGPATYGKDPGPPPDPDALPEPLRTLLKVQIWFMEQGMSAASNNAKAEGRITGAPGSPGSYTGPARIVRSEAEFTRIAAGDVLVCPITTPTWSVLFAQAGAVVTDGGGVLAHAAIIAREHGIPAVLGTGDATRFLRDGQTVMVDGTAGTVQVLT